MATVDTSAVVVLVVVVLVVVVAAISWMGVSLSRRRRADARFRSSVSGGRGGTITIRCGGREARAEYEVGSKSDFLVYASSLAWVSGGSVTTKDIDEIARTLQSWAHARGSKLTVATDGRDDA